MKTILRLMITIGVLLISGGSGQSLEAQTATPNDKNIDKCLKQSVVKTAAAFDRCVKEEFDRIREEARPKTEREKQFTALLASDKPQDQVRLFYLQLERLRESNDALFAVPGYALSDYTTYPRHSYFHYYYPRAFYPRYYPRYFPRHFPRSIRKY